MAGEDPRGAGFRERSAEVVAHTSQVEAGLPSRPAPPTRPTCAPHSPRAGRNRLAAGETPSVHGPAARGGGVSGLADLPPLLTPAEAAGLLRTSKGAIYAMVERAQLPGAVRVGRRLLIRRDDLLAWLGLDGKDGPR